MKSWLRTTVRMIFNINNIWEVDLEKLHLQLSEGKEKAEDQNVLDIMLKCSLTRWLQTYHGFPFISAYWLQSAILHDLKRTWGWGQWHGWNNNLSNINIIFVHVINVFFPNGKYILPFASFEHSIPNITTNMNAQILHRYVSFRSVHDKICIYALQRAGQDQSNPV